MVATKSKTRKTTTSKAKPKKNNGETSKPKRRTASKADQALSAPPDREQVAFRAYQIWQEQGQPEGRDIDHWVRAEQEVNGNR